MCSICGGTKWDNHAEYIFNQSMDRGRDAHGARTLRDGHWIANHRATPTTEVEDPIEQQPVGDNPFFVFNGILANDADLGIREGEADTSVLPRVLDTLSLDSFAGSIKKLVGSFAIAAMNELNGAGEIYLACNYKPIWIANKNGEYYFSSLKAHFPAELNPYRMEPYSVRRLTDDYISIPVPRLQSNRALVIASSGLDSTAVAGYACDRHGPDQVRLIHFDYNCLAGPKEKECIEKIANHFGCSFEILPIASMFFGDGSPLLSDKSIASGIEGAEYAHEWVPARNLVMLALTTAYAEAHHYGHIYLGTNLEEAGAYPDNEEQFILDFDSLLYGAVQNGVKVQIHTPLGGLMKHEIVPFGLRYDAPFDLTWSCYRGGEKHCNECGPCFMRKTAFERNGLKDPVFEEDVDG
jgi:7-cyano-7-deazaguanine synthase